MKTQWSMAEPPGRPLCERGEEGEEGRGYSDVIERGGFFGGVLALWTRVPFKQPLNASTIIIIVSLQRIAHSL